MTTNASDARMLAVFLSHGAPILADDDQWTNELAMWAQTIVKPKSVLVVSAHWEAAPLMVGATTTVPLLYDFYGFPQRYYEVTYPAPGAPELADSVAKLLRHPGRVLHQDAERGLDHGAYVPLAEMYPDADVPVLQISMPTLDPAELFRLGSFREHYSRNYGVHPNGQEFVLVGRAKTRVVWRVNALAGVR